MGEKKRRNGKGKVAEIAPAQIPIAAQPPVESVDMEAVLRSNPVAGLQAQNFALRRALAQKDAEILELTKRLATKGTKA